MILCISLGLFFSLKESNKIPDLLSLIFYGFTQIKVESLPETNNNKQGHKKSESEDNQEFNIIVCSIMRRK